MTGTRAPVALLAGVLVCVLLTAAGMLGRSDPPAPAAGPSVADRTSPLAVLGAWDRARSQAWRSGDRTALAALYTDGSRAGRADVRLLAAYDARGLRVRGLAVQRATVAVRHASPDRLVLVVTDRVVGAWAATGTGGRVALPRDGWSTRRVEMVRAGERWLVAGVRDRVGPGPTRRPR